MRITGGEDGMATPDTVDEPIPSLFLRSTMWEKAWYRKKGSSFSATTRRIKSMP
jgi:hypothetical protein